MLFIRVKTKEGDDLVHWHLSGGADVVNPPRGNPTIRGKGDGGLECGVSGGTLEVEEVKSELPVTYNGRPVRRVSMPIRGILSICR